MNGTVRFKTFGIHTENTPSLQIPFAAMATPASSRPWPSAHHGNLDALIGKSGNTPCPFSFDGGPAFELKTELSKEINCPSEVIDDDSYVIHSFERHASTLHNVARMHQRHFAAPKHEGPGVCQTPEQPLIGANHGRS